MIKDLIEKRMPDRLEICKDDEARIRALRTRALVNEDQMSLGLIDEVEYRQTLEEIDALLRELEVKYGIRPDHE